MVSIIFVIIIQFFNLFFTKCGPIYFFKRLNVTSFIRCGYDDKLKYVIQSSTHFMYLLSDVRDKMETENDHNNSF